MRLTIVLLLLVALCIHQTALGQASASPVLYSTPGAIYTQNFDGLPNAGSFSLTGKGPFNLSGSPISGSALTGWQLMMASGSNANAIFSIGTGSGTGNGVYSFGNSASTDRALGSLASSTGIYAFGLLLTNNTGGILNSFTLGFTAEQWRKGGSGNKNIWSFHYKTGSLVNMDQPEMVADSGLNFNSVVITTGGGSLNGNLADNQQNISFTISNITWKPGEQLLLRWDDVDESGSDDACAIDNIRFSASLISSLPVVTNGAVSNVTANSAVLNGSVNDHFANTSVLFEYDTANGWQHPQSVRPIPDTIRAGSGNSLVNATLTSLLPGRVYYWRIKASNQNGTVVSAAQNFTTSINLPTVATTAVLSVTTHSALLGGTITASGGATVTERGIVWSVNPNPDLSNNKITSSNGTDNFVLTENNLPPGKKVYVRAYATNAGGTAYGNEVSFFTLNSIISLTANSPVKTNAGSVTFSLRTTEALNGLSMLNCKLLSNSIVNASITGISISGNICLINVNTGTGSGLLGLSITNNTGLSSSIENLPFTSTDFYTVDKTAPVIKGIEIPDRSMKIGDTVALFLSVIPDREILTLTAGTMNGITLTGFTKFNDSMYNAVCIIPNSGNDVAASDDIPVSVSLKDSVGNIGIYQNAIRQMNDLIDVHRPTILSIKNPPDKIYKSGDTLDFIFRFNENILVTSAGMMASLSVTIGSKSKAAFYDHGTGSDSIVFRYIIQPGETDKDGIRTASSILLNTTEIKDIAGNAANLSFSNSNINKGILIDAVAPTVSSVSVPPKAVYRTGNILDFVVNYSKKIWISGDENVISLQLNIGTKNRTANYISGNGSNALLFRYTIVPDDTDNDGIKLAAAINTNTAIIKDDVGNIGLLNLNNIGSMSGIRINPLTAAIQQIIMPDNAVYKTGETLEFQIVYNERVSVATNAGIPYLRFTAGKTSKQAFYKNGSGSNVLLFSYTVQKGDEDVDGIKSNPAITLNNGFITDTLGNPAPLSFVIPDNTNGILLDGIAPFANSIASSGTKMYRIGDTINLDLVFSEKVMVDLKTDTPFIQITIGSLVKKIQYASGSGTDHLLFRYIVREGELDKNGIKAGVVLFNNQSISDIAGNIADATIKNAGVLQGVFVDGVAPIFTVTKTDTIRICENSDANDINTFFSVSDSDANDLLKWKIISLPNLGEISATSFTLKLNGKTVSPSVFSYTAFTNKNGIDSVAMEVTDSLYFVQKKLIIIIQPAINNYEIKKPQVICTNQSPAVFSGNSVSGGDGTYLYSWEISVNDSLHFVKASGSNTAANYHAPAINSNSWFRRKIISGSCAAISAPIKVTVVKNGLWTGSKDNNWNNPDNWCDTKLPDNTTSVIIHPDAVNTARIKDSVLCNQLTVMNKASLQITGVLNITGDISSTEGSIDAGGGTLLITGNTPQTISGNSFEGHRIKKLIINNYSSTQIQDSLVLTEKIIMYNGSLLTNDQLYLQKDAVIGASAAGTSIKGKVFAEHLIKGGRRSFYLLGNSFNEDMNLQMLKDSLDITGDGGKTNGFTNTITNQPSAFMHDPLKGNDSLGIDAGWEPFANIYGVNGNLWKKNTGIRVLMRGRPGQGLDGTPAGNGTSGTYLPLPVLLKLAGQVNTGDQEIFVRKDKYAGYNVVSNPYLSQIDLSHITRGGDIGMHYWVWNPYQGKKGGYSSIPFRSKYVLPPMGSFIVRANGTINNSLLFTENSKTNDLTIENIPVTDIDDAFHVELQLETDSILWDRVLLFAIDSARSSFDKNDAEKFINPDVNFYSLSKEQRRLSIDARPVTNESVIKLGLQVDEPGKFAIRIAKANLPVADKLMLHDTYIDKWVPLEKDSMYSFTTTMDTLSFGDQRFEIAAQKKLKDSSIGSNNIIINISPVPVKNFLQVSFKAAEVGNTSIRLLTLSGTAVKVISLGIQKEAQIMIPVSELVSGIYLLELTCGEKIITRKLIKD